MYKTKICSTCGKDFTPRGGKQRCCSPECRDNEPGLWIDMVCAHCGAAFRRDKWKASRNVQDYAHQYCGDVCYHKSQEGTIRGDYKPPEERTCLGCGKPFLVGGRGRPQKTVQYCSSACHRLSLYRHGVVGRQMSPTEAAYLAGLVDGEGSIILYKRRDAVALRLVISNTNRKLLEWVFSTTEVGNAHVNARQTNEMAKPSGYWSVNADGAVSILEQISPYLVIKDVQAALGLDFQKRLQDPKLKRDRTWQVEAREQMQLLNRRGPPLAA